MPFTFGMMAAKKPEERPGPLDPIAGHYTYEEPSLLGSHAAGWFFDIMQRPAEVVGNLWEEATVPRKRTAAEIFMPITKLRPPQETNPFPTLFETQLAADRAANRGMIAKALVGHPKAERAFTTVGDILGSIGMDPAMLASVGGITAKGFKALEAGETVTKGVSLAKQAERGHRALVGYGGLPIVRGTKVFEGLGQARQAPVVRPILDLFRPGSKIPFIQEALEASKAAGRVEAGRAAEATQHFGTAVKMAAKEGATPADITKMAETLGREAVQPEGWKGAAWDAYGQARSYIEDLEKRIGLTTPELASTDDAGLAMEYILHRMTPGGGKWFGKIKSHLDTGMEIGEKERGLLETLIGEKLPTTTNAAGRIVTKWSPFHTSMLGRNLSRNQDIEGLNTIFKQFGFKGKAWVDNPVELLARRWGMAKQSLEKTTFMDNLVDGAFRNGLAVKATEKLKPNVSQDVIRYLKPGSPLRAKLESVHLSDEVAKEMGRVFKAYISPGDTQAALKYYDKALGIWKGWTLGPFIPYHVRNVVSDDAWFSFLALGPGKQRYWDYAAEAIGNLPYGGGVSGAMAKIPQAYGRAVGAIPRLLGGKEAKPIAEWTAEAVERGVVGHGMVAGETVQGAMKPIKGFLAMGRAREDLSRLAHYFARRDAGWNPIEAANDVVRYHYDYSRDALSTFEQQVPARALFFYRWLRFNTPASYRNLLMHWGKHSAVARTIKGIESKYGEETGYPQDWVKERFPFVTPYGRFLTQAWFPPTGAADIRHIPEQLAPIPKMIAELISNHQMYFNRPIQAYPGQRETVVPGLPKVPAYAAYLLRGWRGVPELSRMVKRTEEGGVPGLIASALLGSRFYPIDPIKEARTQYYDAKADYDAIEKDKDRAMTEGDGGEVERLWQLQQEPRQKMQQFQWAK